MSRHQNACDIQTCRARFTPPCHAYAQILLPLSICLNLIPRERPSKSTAMKKTEGSSAIHDWTRYALYKSMTGGGEKVDPKWIISVLWSKRRGLQSSAELYTQLRETNGAIFSGLLTTIPAYVPHLLLEAYNFLNDVVGEPCLSSRTYLGMKHWGIYIGSMVSCKFSCFACMRPQECCHVIEEVSQSHRWWAYPMVWFLLFPKIRNVGSHGVP